MNLREEKGYTYGAHSYLAPQRGVQPWVVATAVEGEKTAESLQELRREIAEIQSVRKLTAAEFEDARNNWVLRFPQNFETQQQVCDSLVGLWALGLPLDFHAATLEKVRTLTLEAVQSAGEKVLAAAPLLVVAVGDEENIAPALEGVGLGTPPAGCIAENE